MTDKATIQDVVDAIDRQTAVIERALEPRRLIIPEGEWDGKMPTRLLWASLPDVQPSEASQGTPTAANAPEPAQTLADLTPCLGDRVRVYDDFFDRSRVAAYGWVRASKSFGWLTPSAEPQAELTRPATWTVVEHLDPVTPEEPPVGAGMLVDSCGGGGCLRRKFPEGWRAWDGGTWLPAADWLGVLIYGPLRPAIPADLAEHGVDEQGEPVGRGEQVTITMRPGWRHSTAEHWRTEASILRDLRPETASAAALCDALADALGGAR